MTEPTPATVSRKPSPLVRVAGKYGIITGLILFAGLVVLYYLGKHPLMLSILFDLRIFMFLLFIFVGIREFKVDVNRGILHFWQGLSIGILIYISAVFITSLLIWIFGAWIEPGFVESYIELSLENLQQNREIIVASLGEERYEAAVQGLPSTTARNLAFDYFLKSMPIGFILTLIISILLRKQN